MRSGRWLLRCHTCGAAAAGGIYSLYRNRCRWAMMKVLFAVKEETTLILMTCCVIRIRVVEHLLCTLIGPLNGSKSFTEREFLIRADSLWWRSASLTKKHTQGCFVFFPKFSHHCPLLNISQPPPFCLLILNICLFFPFLSVLSLLFTTPVSFRPPSPRGMRSFSQTSSPVNGRPVGRAALLTDDEFQGRAGWDPPSLHSSMTTTLNHKLFFTPHSQWHVYFILSLLWISSRRDMCIKSSGTVLCKNLFWSDLHSHTNI